jgi:hypothetical protein
MEMRLNSPLSIITSVSVRLQKYHWKFSENFFNIAFRSRANRENNSLTSLDLNPCLSEFRDAFFFPLSVTGPVEFCQGRF